MKWSAIGKILPWTMGVVHYWIKGNDVCNEGFVVSKILLKICEIIPFTMKF